MKDFVNFLIIKSLSFMILIYIPVMTLVLLRKHFLELIGIMKRNGDYLLNLSTSSRIDDLCAKVGLVKSTMSKDDYEG